MIDAMTARRPAAAPEPAIVREGPSPSCIAGASATSAPTTEALNLDLSAIVSQVQHALYAGNQALRQAMLTRSRQMQDELLGAAEQEFRLEMKAAKESFAANVTSAIADIAGGAVQIGGAGLALKHLRASAAQTATSDQVSQTAIRLRHELGSARVGAARDRRVLRNLAKNADPAGHDAARTEEFKRRMEQSLASNERRQVGLGRRLALADRQAAAATATAERHLRLAQVSTQMGAGVGEAVSGLVKLGAAAHNRDAAEANAQAKLAHAHVDLANLGYQQALDVAGAARDALNESRNMESASAQSTQQTYAGFARNMA